MSAPARLDAGELHRILAGRWPEFLIRLGVDEQHLRNRHGPCPACGGKDRFRFDDKEGRGTWICSQCGAGDGFRLLETVNGWTFAEARRAVIDALGLDRDTVPLPAPRRSRESDDQAVAQPTARVRDLLRTSAPPEAVQDAIDYLGSRYLWPLPDHCSWRAHAAAEYWDGREMIDRFPALVAEVRDQAGGLVTAHVTYLQNGRKLEADAPRKILSKMTGRRGCAVRLMPLAGEVLGIAEGIETALAAHRFHGVPVWSALNASLLAKFIPPPAAHQVIIFADRDVPSLEAAYHLRDELDGRCSVELRLPPAPANDWADVLAGRSA